MRPRPMLFALLLAAAGCATSPGGAAPRPERPPVIVLIENHNWSDATVYALCGARIRVGRVTSFRPERFRLPVECARRGAVAFEIRLLASRRGYQTHRELVGPGARVELRIENAIQHTSLSIFE